MEKTVNLNFKLEEKLNISDNSIEENDNHNKQYSTIDRVLGILKHVRHQLDMTLGRKDLIVNLNWVIKKIETKTLYSNLFEEIVDEENQIDSEKTEFLEGFQEFSFVNNIHKHSRERMICRTAHQSDFSGFKNMREFLRTQKVEFKKVDINDCHLKLVDEEEEINYVENKKKKTQSSNNKYKKSATMKSSFKPNGKVDDLFTHDLFVEEVDEDSLKYETIQDEKVTSYKIAGSTSNNDEKEEKDDKTFDNTDNTDKNIKESIFNNVNNDNFNMNSIVSRKFNIYHFESLFKREKLIILVGKEIFRALDLINMIDSTKLSNFLTDLRNHYVSTNPYHNDRHGADVGQTVSAYIKESEIIDTCLLQDLDILSMVIAALGHDVGHTGKNNNFHINSKSEYAMMYHDKSVLENFHIFVIFKLLEKEDDNIVSTLKKEEFSILRKRIIESVLATDMSFHGKVLSNIKNKLFSWKELKKSNEEEPFINPSSKTFFDEQQEIINLIIHSADIAHNTKPFVLSEKWTEFLTEEFHQQGDKEKELGLPISFLCDRTTSNVPKSQIGFINFVIIPTFQLVFEAFPSLEYLLLNAKANLAEWEKIHKLNEAKLEKEKRKQINK